MMNRNISLTINAKPLSLMVDVRQSLLEVLRKQGYTSVNIHFDTTLCLIDIVGIIE